MFYHLLYPLRDLISAFNVFRYITFRSAYAAVTALLISFLLGPLFIRMLKRRQLTEGVREYVPESHAAKAGTPTMGGLLILVATLVPTLLWARLDNDFIWLMVFATLWLGRRGVRGRLPQGGQEAQEGPGGALQADGAARARAPHRALRLRDAPERPRVGRGGAVLQGRGHQPRRRLRALRDDRDHGELERGQSDRRARRPGDRPRHLLRAGLRRHELRHRTREVQRLPQHPVHRRDGGADGLLLRAHRGGTRASSGSTRIRPTCSWETRGRSR